MFEKMSLNLIYIDEVSSEGYFPVPISYSSLYQIRCVIVEGKNLEGKKPHIEGKIKIRDGSYKPKIKIIFEHQIFNSFVDSFAYNPLNKLNDGVSALLDYYFSNVELSFILLIEIYEIKMKFIESLNTTEENKKEILQINMKFLLKEYKDTLLRIGTFGETIARELMRKINAPWKNFGSAINKLVSTSKPRSKINYQFLGHLLSSLYYIRNQTHHPNSKIEINDSVAEYAIKNLSLILEHINDKNIKF